MNTDVSCGQVTAICVNILTHSNAAFHLLELGAGKTFSASYYLPDSCKVGTFYTQTNYVNHKVGEIQTKHVTNAIQVVKSLFTNLNIVDVFMTNAVFQLSSEHQAGKDVFVFQLQIKILMFMTQHDSLRNKDGKSIQMLSS